LQPVTGTPETIQHITHDDIKTFHKNYFAPNNMIVTVVSALPIRTTARVVIDSFGGMDRCSELPRPPDSFEPVEKGTIEVIEEGKRNYVIYGYPFKYEQENSGGLSVAVSLFSSDVTFQWREVEGGAYGMGASISHYGDTGWFWTRIGTTKSAEEALNAVRECLADFREKEVTAEEIERIINSSAGWKAMKLMTREGRAYALAMRELSGKELGSIGIGAEVPPISDVKLPRPMK